MGWRLIDVRDDAKTVNYNNVAILFQLWVVINLLIALTYEFANIWQSDVHGVREKWRKKFYTSFCLVWARYRKGLKWMRLDACGGKTKLWMKTFVRKRFSPATKSQVNDFIRNKIITKQFQQLKCISKTMNASSNQNKILRISLMQFFSLHFSNLFLNFLFIRFT